MLGSGEGNAFREVEHKRGCMGVIRRAWDADNNPKP